MAEGKLDDSVSSIVEESENDEKVDNENPSDTTEILSEPAAREALEKFVEKHCCYRKAPLKNLTIDQIKYSETFLYTLETYLETRTLKWKYVPYDCCDEPLDGCQNGAIPSKWNVNVGNMAGSYVKGKTKVIMPHSCSKVVCTNPSCLNGRSICYGCGGSGWTQVYRTDSNNRGYYEQQICFSCGGMGRVKCVYCNGCGYQLKYLSLKVKRRNEMLYAKITALENLPAEKLLKGARTSKIVFHEDKPKVQKIPADSGFPATTMTTSENSINEHAAKFPQGQDEVILCQRQRVRQMRAFHCKCTLHDDQREFFVFGNENLIYFPEYYAKCCGCWCCCGRSCCCTIL